jgi:uncharacterized membrane protein
VCCGRLALAPLKPGGSWLALKAAPLLLPLYGVWKRDVYTLQWTSMMILLYFTEGVVRGWSDRQLSAWLGWGEAASSCVYFVCAIMYLRPYKRAAKRWPRSCWTRSRSTRFHDGLPQQCRAAIGEQPCAGHAGRHGALPHRQRGRFTGKALAVLRPGSVEEVAALVRACAEHRVALCRKAAIRDWCWAACPMPAAQVVLSLARLNRIRRSTRQPHHDGGCRLHPAANPGGRCGRGLLFPLSLAAEGSCTIGGNLVHQCRRHGGPALRQYARTVPRPGSGHAAGRDLERLARPAQDNTGYDCATCSSARKARWASSPAPY